MAIGDIVTEAITELQAVILREGQAFLGRGAMEFIFQTDVGTKDELDEVVAWFNAQGWMASYGLNVSYLRQAITIGPMVTP